MLSWRERFLIAWWAGHPGRGHGGGLGEAAPGEPFFDRPRLPRPRRRDLLGRHRQFRIPLVRRAPLRPAVEGPEGRAPAVHPGPLAQRDDPPALPALPR